MNRHLITAAAIASAALVLVSTPSAFAQPEPDAPVASTLSDGVQAAVDGGAVTPAEIAQSIGLPSTGPSSLASDADGRLTVTISFATKPTDAQRDAVAAIASVERVNSFTPTISARVAPTRLADLNIIGGVISVTPVLAPTVGSATSAAPTAAIAPRSVDPASCTPFPSDASAPLAADLARLDYGVDGSGVKVGIISDSFDVAQDATTRPADDIAAGALPGPGNPCGWTTPVDVVQEAEDGGGDEGRAMAQIVHGIAPGAELLFATGGGYGPVGMAEVVIELAENGATVIVDDLGFAQEPVYQQGILSAAIDYVEEKYGVAYYSAVGNDNVTGRGPSAGRPIGAWETEAYRPSACPSWVVLPASTTSADCLDFDPSTSTQAWDRLSLNGVLSPIPLVSWGEPVNGVTTDMVAQLYREDGDVRELVGTTTRLDANIPNAVMGLVDQDPDAVLPAGRYDLVLLRNTTNGVPTTTPPVWLAFNTGANALTHRQFFESTGPDRVGRTAYGHEADGSNIAVAAAPAKDPSKPEPFTGQGPGVVYFEQVDPSSTLPAAALAVPVEVATPHITGIDGVRTTFFSSESQEEGKQVWRFYGTSAAAPSIAAVHALAQSYLGHPDANLIWTAIEGSARPISNPWSEYTPDQWVIGAGLPRTDVALAALPERPAPGPQPAVLASTGTDFDSGTTGLAAAALILGGLVLVVRRRHRLAQR